MQLLFESEKAAADAKAAVSHEARGGSRATAHITQNGSVLNVAITADDVVAFRATLNSLLRDFQAIEGSQGNDL
jgi:tRNA threonylcarbamoyladenosine modification (KEOPS) complex  Pcc1 subunit